MEQVILFMHRRNTCRNRGRICKLKKKIPLTKDRNLLIPNHIYKTQFKNSHGILTFFIIFAAKIRCRGKLFPKHSKNNTELHNARKHYY